MLNSRNFTDFNDLLKVFIIDQTNQVFFEFSITHRFHQSLKRLRCFDPRGPWVSTRCLGRAEILHGLGGDNSFGHSSSSILLLANLIKQRIKIKIILIVYLLLLLTANEISDELLLQQFCFWTLFLISEGLSIGIQNEICLLLEHCINLRSLLYLLTGALKELLLCRRLFCLQIWRGLIHDIGVGKWIFRAIHRSKSLLHI